MKSKLLDGKIVRDTILDHLKQEAAGMVRKPTLAVVTVGDDPASKIYVNIKEQTCFDIGYGFRKFMFKQDATLESVIECIHQLNTDPIISGIIVQMPLPESLWGKEETIIAAVHPSKDVDGLHPLSMGSLSVKPTVENDRLLIAPTPMGVIRLLHYYDIALEGKNVVLIGRSTLVGKPLMALLLSHNATVTVCHSKTIDLASVTKRADILISSVGKPLTIMADMVKKGAVVIDVGIIQVGEHVVGDVDFTEVSKIASAITPVPGGVGPMTIACLLENVMKAHKHRERA